MPGNLPKLSKLQMDRLVEIGLANSRGKLESSRNSPIRTDQLVDMGLVERRIVKTTPTGRILGYGAWVKEDGIRVLAGFPGDEFDRFREMQREADHARHD